MKREDGMLRSSGEEQLFPSERHLETDKLLVLIYKISE